MNSTVGSGKKVSVMIMLASCVFLVLGSGVLIAMPIIPTTMGQEDTANTTTTSATTTTNNNNNNTTSATPLTPNQIAAGGPIPPNWTMALEEAECAATVENPPFFPTVTPAEHFNGERQDYFPCAQFPGSMTEPNDVYAYQSSDVYVTPFSLATRGIGELYVYGGGTGDATPPSLQTYVARVEPGTLKEVWRTYLNNANITNQLHVSGGVYALADGSLAAMADHTLYKLNATSGEVVATVDIPTGDNPPRDSAFNGFSAFPDGTLVLKSMNRPVGCELNGYTAAAFLCPGAPASANPSVLSVVDSRTWEVLDSIQGEENSIGRVSAVQYNGKNYAYFAGSENVYRYVWDGMNITLDESWGPVPYLKPGQTISGALVLTDNFVLLSTNGNPANVPMTVMAISHANSSDVHSIDPIPLEPGQQSTYFAHGAFDPDNNVFYVMDAGPHKAAAINIDPQTGNMSVAWIEDQWSQSYITLLGPADKRVFVNTNMSSDVTQNWTQLRPGPEGANYVEQIQWRDAATGELLAASDFFSPTAPAATVPVGFGGLIYNLLNTGQIMALQVLPASSPSPSISPSSPSANSTSTQSGAG
jgi:hypothetical protein